MRFTPRRLSAVVATAALGVAVTLPMMSGVSSAAQRPANAKAAAAKHYFLEALKHGLVGGPMRGAHVAGHSVSNGTTDTTSTNWSGYADTNSSSNTYTKVSASWTEPAVVGSCPSATEITSFWVGLDGYGTDSVEQDGASNVCYEGSSYDYDWYEMYPAGSVGVNDVNAKDKISAKVVDVAGTYTLSVTDATNPSDSFSTSSTCSSGCDNGSAEWIGESPCCVGSAFYPLTPYKTWQVHSASVTSGTTKGTISTFPNAEITQINSADTYDLQKPGALNAKGNTFTDKFLASS